MYMFSLVFFLVLQETLRLQPIGGRPIRRTYHGATAYTTACPGWPQNISKYVNTYIHMYVFYYHFLFIKVTWGIASAAIW